MTTPARSTSDHGRAFLIEEEKAALMPYKDPAGYLTIGVGHLITKEEQDTGTIFLAVDWKKGLGGKLVDLLLTSDLSPTEDAINQHVTVSLNQNQFDALVSFVFNVGEPHFVGSTLLKVLNQGQYNAVPDQLRRWKFAGGKPILANRREREIQLWNTPT